MEKDMTYGNSDNGNEKIGEKSKENIQKKAGKFPRQT